MPMTDTPALAGDAERRLLEALAQRYVGDPFSARDAAAAIPCTLWQAAGVARPDANSCGRWLRSHRSASLTGKPDRSGVVRWRLRGAASPVAALQAPAPAARPPAPPQAQQVPQPAPEPLPPPQPPQAPPRPPERSWWHPPAPAADIGLPGPRWGCTAWWAPDGGSAS
jgi:hypothetical protein